MVGAEDDIQSSILVAKWERVQVNEKVTCELPPDMVGFMKSTNELDSPVTYGVLLAAVLTPEMSEDENQASLDELARLVKTLGRHVCGQIWQRKSGYGSKMVLGEGKLFEIADRIVELASSGMVVTQVIFDRELSPLQGRNVEQMINGRLLEREYDTEISVTDRTGVIIEIFSRHAKTRQARLQIEMARLKYTAPRLRGQVEHHGDRQAGGIGAKGAGETALELKRRQLRDRVAELRRELESLESENELRREKRHVQTVGLVGYTNAGKSSLMRGLTGSDVYVADKLFATLDVTTRQLHPPAVPPILITDTVGFVRFLPHDLVASFKSSLAEANHADFLLHVVDASDPQFRTQMKTTEEVLTELGANQQERQIVLNKIDQVTIAQMHLLQGEFPMAWMVSAVESESLQELRQKIVRHFEQNQKLVQVLIPFSESRLIGEIRKVATVTNESYNEIGTLLNFQIKPADLGRLRSYFPQIEFVEKS
jgi:GTP-binding protein HflX